MSRAPMSKAQVKERIRERIRVQIDENNYEYFPETIVTDAHLQGVS